MDPRTGDPTTKGATIVKDPAGCDVSISENGDILLSQSPAIARFVPLWGLADAHPTTTPLPTGFTADPGGRPARHGTPRL